MLKVKQSFQFKVYIYFFNDVHPRQSSRATQCRGLLNEVCDLNVRKSEDY